MPAVDKNLGESCCLYTNIIDNPVLRSYVSNQDMKQWDSFPVVFYVFCAKKNIIIIINLIYKLLLISLSTVSASRLMNITNLTILP